MTTAPTTSTPDLSDYHVVHHALRTAPHRMVAAIAEVDPGDTRRARALQRYWIGYAGEVLAHHTVEDDVFFPRLAERVPVIADHLARTDHEHHELDRLMTACTDALQRFAAAASPATAAEAAAALVTLADLMDRHLAFEDEDLLPLFGRHFTATEYDKLTQAAMKGLPMRQALFSVPFVLHWASPADTAKMLAEAPRPLRVLHRLTRGRHARLATLALGRFAAPQEVLV